MNGLPSPGRVCAWLTPRRFAGLLAPLVLASFPEVAFQAVEMPAGRHEVELGYRDDAFRFGCLVSLAGLVMTGLVWRRR